MTDKNFPRRTLLRGGMAAAVSSAAGFSMLMGAGTARAQAAGYPNRPIRILIGTPPGDTADSWVRQLSGGMTAVLGQPIIIDNKPGAHGMIVGTAAKTAPSDGYTLLASTGGPMSINPSVYKEKLSYDPLKDFVAIAPVTRGGLFLYCNNDVPVKNIKDMVAWVKARPGKVSYGSGGTGTTQHLAMEQLKKATGMEMTHVPYRGSPMVLQDVIGGQIPFAFDAGGSLLPQARNGKVRVIAVTTPQRYSGMPEVPTLAEQGVANFEARVWMGIFAPAGTPAEIVARVNEAVTKVAAGPEFSARMTAAGGESWTGSSEDLRKFLVADIARWAEVVKAAGVQPE